MQAGIDSMHFSSGFRNKQDLSSSAHATDGVQRPRPIGFTRISFD
jgi:hypothetical protein